jgi:hypothetical protein
LRLTWPPLLVGLASGRLLGERLGRVQLVAVLAIPAGAVAYFTGSLGATRRAGGMRGGAGRQCRLVADGTFGQSRSPAAGPLVTTAVSRTAGALVLLAPGLATVSRCPPAPPGRRDTSSTRRPTTSGTIAERVERRVERPAELGQLRQRSRLDAAGVETTSDEPVRLGSSRRVGKHFARDAVQGLVKFLIAAAPIQ